ncbi:MAG: hypothetical protein EBY24_08290 [Betaproteobacteria bacterium]|nr:hypothetical protein [Betaproteobacteria bacterium]
MKTPLAVSSTSTAGVVIQVYQALYGKAPGYTDYSSYLAQASANNREFVNALMANFAATSDKALALLVLNNLGITAATVTQSGSYAALLSAVEQIFAAYGSAARGQILLNMTTLLAGLSSDVTFGAAATTYSTQVQANYSYSATSTNTSSSVVALTAATVPGAPTIGAATAGDAQASVAFSAPSSTGGASISAYTVSCVSGSSTKTGSASSSPITVSSMSNASAYNCSVTATNSAGTGSASGTVAVTPAAATISSTSAVYYAPAPFASVMQTNYQPASLASASSLVNRSRYMISDAATAGTASNYLSIGSTYSATTGYAASSSSLSSASTYNDYLSKLVQVVSDSSGYFRIDSHLHPNNSIDFDATDSNKLKFRNNFGKASALYGYLTFSYDATTKLLQAKKRYKYSYVIATTTQATTYTGAWDEDASFSSSAQNYYVNLTGGVYKLIADTASATKFYLYESPIDFGIPDALNPNKVVIVTNAAAAFFSKNSVAATEGVSGGIYKEVNATYRSQILTAGNDATTKASADAMLASIKSAVEASGEKLRYSTDLYSAYRDATLSFKLFSDSIADGTPGQNLVPYVYFTNEKNAAGKYHPFMVIVSYGNPASPNGLKDVPHPPGDSTGEYPTLKVTRFSNLENYVAMIPMKDYGVVSDVTDNVIAVNLWTVRTTASLKANVYTYADSADNGILVDGSVIFPTYGNTLVPANQNGEMTAIGCHVGKGGGGPHCHFDGYQSGFSLNIYGDADYIGKSHPPLIGFGYDGIAVFGKYRSSDIKMLGYSTALDDFGAHDHDSIGYHYHAHSVTNHKAELLTITTSMDVLMKGAYVGKTNDIPFFRANDGFNTNPYKGGTVK